MYRLVTTYYRDRNPRRRDELDMCLSINCSTFDSVSVIAEEVLDAPTPRIRYWQSISWRPLYRDAIALAGRAEREEVVVIANCDIILPRESLELIDGAVASGEAYCLTRWEPGYGLWNVDYSQDVWAFRGPPRLPATAGDFRFGVPGCDNRFAAELELAGFRVRNPSQSIRSYHCHATGRRTPTNAAEHRVGLPYLCIAPHALGAEPAYRRPDKLPQVGSRFGPSGEKPPNRA
jgi:hypothetical protein